MGYVRGWGGLACCPTFSKVLAVYLEKEVREALIGVVAYRTATFGMLQTESPPGSVSVLGMLLLCTCTNGQTTH